MIVQLLSQNKSLKSLQLHCDVAALPPAIVQVLGKSHLTTLNLDLGESSSPGGIVAVPTEGFSLLGSLVFLEHFSFVFYSWMDPVGMIGVINRFLTEAPNLKTCTFYHHVCGITRFMDVPTTREALVKYNPKSHDEPVVLILEDLIDNKPLIEELRSVVEENPRLSVKSVQCGNGEGVEHLYEPVFSSVFFKTEAPVIQPRSSAT